MDFSYRFGLAFIGLRFSDADSASRLETIHGEEYSDDGPSWLSDLQP